ncbi:hypothetical protein B5X24_HaOG202683 [Helicoverpa armigera]|uniref:Kazal-like domain-containing protein n=1 Tax=Helicoverpa armigera TaxID=29058 RepID=A0A2W1BUH9_HELAM|nr:hypothetical protein B5X24_HaOG202683 [Helicoverpa armigera]
MILLRCSIVATIIFIPLTSIQHFLKLEPLSNCLLADICNHTWIPECGQDETTKHLRLFIDECDLSEYNCDYDMNYTVVNYSECFGPAAHTHTCPTVGKLFRKIKGYHIYQVNRRMMHMHMGSTPALVPITEITPRRTKMRTQPGKRRYTPEKTKRFKTTTTELPPCMRGLTGHTHVMPPPKPKRKEPRRFMPQITPQRITTKIIKALTTQVSRTSTVGTVELNRVTVWKNGRKMVKVVKGFQKPKTT